MPVEFMCRGCGKSVLALLMSSSRQVGCPECDWWILIVREEPSGPGPLQALPEADGSHGVPSRLPP